MRFTKYHLHAKSPGADGFHVFGSYVSCMIMTAYLINLLVASVEMDFCLPLDLIGILLTLMQMHTKFWGILLLINFGFYFFQTCSSSDNKFLEF